MATTVEVNIIPITDCLNAFQTAYCLEGTYLMGSDPTGKPLYGQVVKAWPDISTNMIVASITVRPDPWSGSLARG